MTFRDCFGYLPLENSLSLTCGSITPLPELQAVVARAEKHANSEGYLYPDPLHPPAPLHQLPPTHRIELPSHPDDQEKARYGLAGFLMHMLGFLYGRRCQFHGWWFDGRVSVRNTSDHSEPRVDDAVYCLEQAASTWSSWPDRQKTIMVNALFLKMRTRVYELEWERFQAEYQVLDALYSIARDLGRVGKVSHKEIIPTVCHELGLGIPSDKSQVNLIVALRNDLIHEALWDGGMPGKVGNMRAYYSSIWLDHLSRRLLLALLGIRAKYLRSDWWTIGHWAFSVER